MVVPQGQGPRPGQAVEVAAAVGALDRQAACTHGDDRQGACVGARRGLARGLAPQDPFVRRPRPLGGAGRTSTRPFGPTENARRPLPRLLGLTPHRHHRRLGHGHDFRSSRCPEASWRRGPERMRQVPRTYQRRRQLGEAGDSKIPAVTEPLPVRPGAVRQQLARHLLERIAYELRRPGFLAVTIRSARAVRITWWRPPRAAAERARDCPPHCCRSPYCYRPPQTAGAHPESNAGRKRARSQPCPLLLLCPAGLTSEHDGPA